MADPRLPPLPAGGTGQGLRMERCILNKEQVMLPEAFNSQTNIFEHVMSVDTWNNVLDEEERKRLKALLPTFPEDDEAEKDETVRRLFNGDNFKFGNPLQQFHKKLKDGLLSPDIAKCNRMCRKFKKREYKFTQQKYLSNLVSEIIVSRERTLHLRNGQPPDKVLPFRSVPKPERNKDMKDRVEKNYHRILKEAREECNLEDTSSEEEESINTVQRSKRQLHRSLGPIPSPEPTTPSVVATFASKPSTLNGDISGNANKRPRALSPVEITDDHYRQMLKRHKRRKLEEPNIPELNTTEVTLQDILNRCQASKKTNKTSPVVTANGDAGQEVEVPVAALAAVAGASPVTTTPAPTTTPTATGKKKPQPRVPRVKTEKKIKRKVKSEKEEMEEVGDVSLTLQPAATNLDVHSDLLTHRDDGVPDFPLVDALPARLSMGQADNFFSLLRDIICDFPDSKATTAKVEERVREWQESPAISLNSWVHTENWVELVISALKFLSGDVLGLSVENFVPFLDYKERAQQWKWIGAGRDSNQQLSPLFRHWLKHKNSLPVDSLNSTQGSPPPVRTKTSFVVRPTLPTEKALYREQERRRFDNPHRAFTYHLHGYDSVVGPVKGVYNKENAITKAREHNLLISDRPAYVTILTLVRDAAARLPNGEGTRGDICELLKDSQFLSPGVTDTQINTVVSGALDRLHSEKDPCVKYDVNSKLWIYLHRSRTEEEFERIHQAQGAAAKAKKSLQRPKTSKAIKDHMSQSTAASVKAALAQNVASAAAVASGSGDLPLDPITPLVTAPTSLTQPPTKVLTAAEATLQQVRNGKGKQMTAAKAAAAAAVASANSMAIVTTTPQQATTTNVPGATSALTKPAASKGRAPVVNVTASGTPSLLGPRTQSPAHTAQQSPSILASLGKGGVASVAGGISVTKAPVVTVTKQGLTPGARPGGNTGGQQVFRSTAAATTQSAAEIILGSSGPAPQSPIILTQDPSSRSSTPTAVTVNTPPPSAKLVTLAQPASAGMVVTGATPPATAAKLVTLAQTGGTTVGGGVVVTGAGSDGAMITRLVQQVAGGAQQVVNVSSLPAKGLPQASGQQRSTTLKIQGGSIVQPIVGGKPVALSGKPLLQFGKGGQPLGVIQTSQGQISTLSLIPQPAPSTAQASSASHSPSANASKITVAAAASKSSSGSSSPVTLTMVASGGTTLPKASILASTGASTLPAQAKVVTPSQAGMVVTQLAPGLSLRPAGLTAASQAKVVTGGQAGLVPTQFIVQQAPPPSASQATAQGTPLMVSQAGGKGGQQNIQVVRTVLSPQGLKPGQATILISQPALQQAAAAATGSVISSAQVIHTAGASAPGVGKASGRGSPKGKAQPVYARIITPPPGMKLTTVGPNQVQATGGNVNMLQTVGKLLAGLPTAATAASTGGATVTIPTSSPSPAVVVATAQNTASGQSLLKSQPSDTSDASNSDAQS